MGIIDCITAGFKAVAAIFGFAQQRDAEKNTAPMQAAAASQQEQSQQDAEAKATADKNLATSRKELAE